jgi:hypothetical protein
LKKCHFEEMSFWRNVILKKCHFEEMSFWRNVILKKYHFEKMSSWRNFILMVFHLDSYHFKEPNFEENSFCWNVYFYNMPFKQTFIDQKCRRQSKRYNFNAFPHQWISFNKRVNSKRRYSVSNGNSFKKVPRHPLKWHFTERHLHERLFKMKENAIIDLEIQDRD